MRRRFRVGLIFLLLGLVSTVGVAWVLAVLQDVQQGRESSGSAFVDQVQWSVTRWDRAGAIQVTSVRIKGSNWSPQQAAGAPDTPSVADQTSAWASQTPDGGTEWLTLSYARAVLPKELEIYESYGPGALFKVTAFDEADHETQAWSGTDPSPAGSSSGTTPVSKIPLSVKFATRKVRIYLASDKVPGWNEIDAVGLVAENGDRQWARSVQASSTYASGLGTSATGGDPQVLVPSWTHLRQPSDPMTDGAANREERQVDARGWPMVALMSQVDTLASGARSSTPAPPVSAYTTGSLRSTGAFAVATPSAARVPVPIPFLPVWSGLVGDTVFYGVIWLAAWSALTVPRRFVRDVARFRRGACIECGYDLGYDFVNGCPECGWRRDRRPPRTPTSPAPPPRRTPAQDATSVR
jgi:hypothetical protein